MEIQEVYRTSIQLNSKKELTILKKLIVDHRIHIVDIFRRGLHSFAVEKKLENIS